MQDSQPSLYAFIFTSICVVILVVMELQDLISVVKPVIVPAIFYYYTQTTNRPISVFFTVALSLFFMADMAEVFDSSDHIYLIMACGLISYIIMFRYALREKIRLIFSFKTIITAFAIFSTSVVLSSNLIIGSAIKNSEYLFFFIIYAIVIIVMVSYGIVRRLSNYARSSKFFLAMALLMFISDLLYTYCHYVTYYKIVAVISLIAQFSSYYFMVEYYNSRKLLTLR